MRHMQLVRIKQKLVITLKQSNKPCRFLLVLYCSFKSFLSDLWWIRDFELAEKAQIDVFILEIDIVLLVVYSNARYDVSIRILVAINQLSVMSDSLIMIHDMILFKQFNPCSSNHLKIWCNDVFKLVRYCMHCKLL